MSYSVYVILMEFELLLSSQRIGEDTNFKHTSIKTCWKRPCYLCDQLRLFLCRSLQARTC